MIYTAVKFILLLLNLSGLVEANLEGFRERQQYLIREQSVITRPQDPEGEVKEVTATFPELGLDCKKNFSNALSILKSVNSLALGEPLDGRLADVVDKLVISATKADEQTVWFAYADRYDLGGLSEDLLRIALFDIADLYWQKIVKQTEKKPKFQQYHVGIGNGARIASIIAYRLFTDRKSPFFDSSPRPNARNQVKLITVNEEDIFSSIVEAHLVGVANYAAFFVDKPSASSSLGTTLHVAPPAGFKETKQLARQQLPPYVIKMPELLTEAHLKQARGQSREMTKAIVAVKNIYHSEEENSLVEKIGIQLFGRNLSNCATNFGKMASLLFDQPITCQLLSQDPKISQVLYFVPDTKLKGSEAVIECSTMANGSKHILSWYAIKITDFAQQGDSCKSIEIAGPDTADPEAKKMEDCLSEIFQDGTALGTLAVNVAKSKAAPCNYVPIRTESQGAGCLAKPLPSSMHWIKLKNNEQTHDLFLQMMKKGAKRFPNKCVGIIKPQLTQQKKVEEDLASIKKFLLSMSAAEQEEAQVALPPSRDRRDDLVILETVSKPTGLQIAPQQAGRLRSCLEDEKLSIINCKSPYNQWIGYVCPEFCSGANTVDFCQNMVYCAKVQTFIGFNTRSFLGCWLHPSLDSEALDSDKQKNYNYHLVKYQPAKNASWFQAKSWYRTKLGFFIEHTRAIEKKRKRSPLPKDQIPTKSLEDHIEVEYADLPESSDGSSGFDGAD